MEWPRPSRAADSIRSHDNPARLVGRVDTDRFAAGRFRAAVGELRARLEIAPRDARSRHRVCDNHACSGHLVDRRSRAGPASSPRRALSHFRIHGLRHPPGTSGRRTDRRHRHNGGARAGTCRRTRRRRAGGRECGESEGWGLQPFMHRRCDPVGHPRTGQQSLPIVARVRGRWRAGPCKRGARSERIPDARIWRFRADRERRPSRQRWSVSRRTVAQELRPRARTREGPRRAARCVRGAGALPFATATRRNPRAFRSC